MTAATDVVVVGAGGRGGGGGGPRPGRRADPTLPAANGTLIDHGGHWIGPTQDRIAALAERVGVTTHPTYERGTNIEFHVERVAVRMASGHGADSRS